jgi:predicted RNA binding protein YcfA (HicA-like mRNA interferase family)
MPKLRRLSGPEVIAILEQFGFVVTRISGSHHRMKLRLNGLICYTTVPVHGRRTIPTGTLRAIYRQAARCVPEDDLRHHFYTD